MRNFLILALVCAAVALSSCGSSGDSAVVVNDVIVGGVDKTVEIMEQVGSDILDDRYDDAKLYLDSASRHIATSLVAIGKLETKSGAVFKQSTLDLLNAISSEGIPAYTKAIELFQTATDEAQMDEANKLIHDFIDRVQNAQNTLKEIQAEFAKKNNITLY